MDGRVMSWRRLGVGLSLGLLLAPGPQIRATESPEQREIGVEVSASEIDPSVRVGLHVVRPGETLESITVRYLGSSRRWRENWKLNELEDPDKIVPGQRIKVLLNDLPADGALVAKVSNRVEDKLLPLSWGDAARNDLLRPNDNVRTFESSSAELLFPDDTRLQLTESSLVIVGESEQITPQLSRSEIEIEIGQADLSRHGGITEASTEIEIVMGDALAQPEAAADGAIETRARKAEGGAQLMVYTGRSTLSAAGQEVAVEEGMGSQVEEGEAPSPPEQLLAAPTILAPKTEAEVNEQRPLFEWQPVPGAVSYTVEICQDLECGVLLQRRTGLAETRWRSEHLPWQTLYWRVTATSASGLDGYRTDPAAELRVLQITDTTAPTVELIVDGPRARRTEQLIVGPGFTLEPRVEDGGSGVVSQALWVDGEEATVEDLEGPWTTGDHTIELMAVDKAGNEGRTRLELTYDDVPPTVSWGLQEIGILGRGLETLYNEAGTPVTGRGPAILEGGGRSFNIDSDYTQVIIKPGGSKIRLPGSERPLTRQRGAWILFEDEICGVVDGLRYGLDDRPSTSGRRATTAVLVTEASDCVGNHTRIAWPIEPTGRR